MLRRFFALSIALGLLAGVWLRSPAGPPSFEQRLTLAPLPLVPGCCTAGPFTLTAAWQLDSPHQDFGGYSAILQPAPGELLAFSDRGLALHFAEPGAPSLPIRIVPLLDDAARLKENRDVESATRDPESGQIWIGLEGRNAIARHDAGLRREAFAPIPAMKAWTHNSGIEAMLRLRDGRFLALCECTPGRLQSGRHPALLFADDPTRNSASQAFTFAGVVGYRPTDMAELPDGRVLIVVRRLIWPIPARFAIKILIADPAEIAPGKVWQAREVADLSGDWPVDNYEGFAVAQQADGTLVGWLISDENVAVTQRVLLLRLRIDPSKL